MSQSGSDDIADCTPPTTSAITTSASTSTHEVRITLSLPMSQSAFTKDTQAAFKASLAQAAGVASEAVVINKIESISSRRHLLAEAIRVETRIMAAGEAAAEEVAGRLAAGSINRELSKAGLPAATVLEAAKPALNSSITLPEPSVSNTGTGAVAAATVASSSSFFSSDSCPCWRYSRDRVSSRDRGVFLSLEMQEPQHGTFRWPSKTCNFGNGDSFHLCE